VRLLFRIVVVFAAIIGLGAFVLGESVSFRQCIQKRYEQNQTNNAASQFEKDRATLFHCGADFAHRYRDEITATATVLLALSTLFLWFTTSDLVKEAERTARRQLRAYVGVILPSGSVVHPTPGQRLSSRIVIKNFGQSPAYEVVINAAIVPDSFPLIGDLPAFDRTPSRTGSRTILHPDQTTDTGGFSKEPLAQEEFGRLRTEHETRRLYFYGEVTYRDIFKKQHTTRFRLHTPAGNADVKQWLYAYDGNEAD
jgi:hypothetical protein